MVRVSGNIDNLQSSIDFYLNITSKEEVLESRFMRDKFFEIFSREESYRNDNFLVYKELVSDNYKISTNEEPELVGEELEFDSSCLYFSSNRYDDVNTIGNVKLENENINLVNEKYFNEKDTTILENEKNIGGHTESPVFEDDFVNWGSDEESSDDEDFSCDEDEFIDWGSSEEYIDESDSSGVEEDEFINWGSEDDEGFSMWGTESKEDNLEVENIDTPGVGDNLKEKGSASEGSKKDDFSDFFKDDLVFFDGCYEEEKQSSSRLKNVILDTEVKSNEVVTTVPSDLRDFIKLYPNCEMSFVYKYFSKKEVEKQLRLGRVFKRKNKLLI